MEDKQIQQETVVPLPQPNPTTYQSKQNDGSLTDSPLPICLVPVPLSVLPLWVDLNDNGVSSSTEIFPLSLKPQSLPPSDDHSGHSSPYAGKSSGGSGDSITGV
ncbi:hypothetical protein TSUD_140010 [Trifolium subterraneum]|uniref:Uncharacterized protein n=1 Tax=Trifolium subterraneum TaxID=3900 RepID=A0A2Z6NZQ0_TRISU|nr:hypothetical protein TSUD_140010 [Trifolium subterraneum]